MKKLWIGDQYDRRKSSLLVGLRAAGHATALAVVPMATDAGEWADDDFRRYLESLGHPGASVASKALFARSRDGNPGTYFSDLAVGDGADLFLDPDTGLTERTPGDGWQRWRDSLHLATAELICLARTNPGRLLLVYDQSVRRGDAAGTHAAGRVAALQGAGLGALAWYWEREGATHPTLVVAVSTDPDCIRALRDGGKTLGADGIV